MGFDLVDVYTIGRATIGLFNFLQDIALDMVAVEFRVVGMAVGGSVIIVEKIDNNIACLDMQVLPKYFERWVEGQAWEVRRLLPHLLLPQWAGQRTARIQLCLGPK